MTEELPTLIGVIVVDKPLGVSSMDVVRRVRGAAKRATGRKKYKVGHGGTLDPLATGVVVCLLGKATKLCDRIMAGAKVYDATVDLSAFTTTDDREGEREEVTVEHPPTESALREAIAAFIGEIEQTPPMFSALHVDGKRAYKLARQGETVDLPSRPVRIDDIKLLSYDWPLVELTITCGKGTYIRSIARDLGRQLNTGGHLASLRRTAVHPYDLSQAKSLEWFQENELRQDDLIDVSQLL